VATTEFPALTLVAVTVRDLSVSVPWYEALFGANGIALEFFAPPS
jgi:hypothetical protein